MTTKYPLSDLTPLPEAVRILVRDGINAIHSTMRIHIINGKLKGQKVGTQYFVLTTEIKRLQDEAKGNEL